MIHARYLQAITKGLHDTVLPTIDPGPARDVLTNSLRALSALAANLDRAPAELLAALDVAGLPSELAAVAADTARRASAAQGLQLAASAPVDDFAVSGDSVDLIRSSTGWLAKTPWLSAPESRSAATALLQWEHRLRTHVVAGIADIEQGRMAGADDAAAVPDIDRHALQRYLRGRVGSDTLEVTDLRFLTGGRVRQTALFSIGGHAGLPDKLVVQRDNPAGLTSFKGPTMQFALLQRVHQAGMRVPRPLFVEGTHDALGGAFLISERVAGVSPVPSMDYFSPPPRSEKLARSLARQIAILHATPVEELRSVMSTTLDPAHKPTWADDIAGLEAAWNANAHAPSMAMTAAFAWMRAHVSQIKDRNGLVHGDMLLHNILVEDEEVSAVLDWEAAHIGHPAEDLGYLRPVIEQMTDWDRFLDEYATAGGHCPSVIESDFFTLRALAQLSVWVQYARATFESGRTHDFNMSEVGAAFLPVASHVIMSPLEAGHCSRQGT